MRGSRLSALLASAVLAFAPAPVALAQINPAPPILRPTPPIQPPARLCPANQRDCDGDGSNATRHGGDDCDDGDANRYPGAPEVADFNGHDEDCDPQTFGQRDADGDGEFDARAYNTDASGRRIGGADCNDTDRRVRSSAQELPNRVDDDCNGHVDDLLGTWYTPPAR
jgi:hypothetical protein